MLIISIICFYYFFLFYTILPIYETSCIVNNIEKTKEIKRKNKIKDNKDFITDDYYENAGSLSFNSANKANDTENVINLNNNNENDNISYIVYEKYFFNIDDFSQMTKLLIKNKGFIYLMTFNFFFCLFIIALYRLAMHNPGKLHKGYNKLYNLKKHIKYYYKFCKKYSENYDLAIGQDKNNLVEIENIILNNYKYQDLNIHNASNTMLENFKLFMSLKFNELNKLQDANEGKIHPFVFISNYMRMSVFLKLKLTNIK